MGRKEINGEEQRGLTKGRNMLITMRKNFSGELMTKKRLQQHKATEALKKKS